MGAQALELLAETIAAIPTGILLMYTYNPPFDYHTDVFLLTVPAADAEVVMGMLETLRTTAAATVNYGGFCFADSVAASAADPVETTTGSTETTSIYEKLSEVLAQFRKFGWDVRGPDFLGDKKYYYTIEPSESATIDFRSVKDGKHNTRFDSLRVVDWRHDL